MEKIAILQRGIQEMVVPKLLKRKWFQAIFDPLNKTIVNNFNK